MAEIPSLVNCSLFGGDFLDGGGSHHCGGSHQRCLRNSSVSIADAEDVNTGGESRREYVDSAGVARTEYVGAGRAAFAEYVRAIRT